MAKLIAAVVKPVNRAAPIIGFDETLENKQIIMDPNQE
jgi:hypothetical protein